jgi:hypothetical protein
MQTQVPRSATGPVPKERTTQEDCHPVKGMEARRTAAEENCTGASNTGKPTRQVRGNLIRAHLGRRISG